MAKIFKTDSQEQALKEILENLKIVESLNKILAAEIQKCKVKITSTESEVSVNETVAAPFAILLQPLKDYRKKLVADINGKAKTYSIQLDDAELAIIDPSAMQPKVEKQPVQEPQKEQLQPEQQLEESYISYEPRSYEPFQRNY